MALSRILASTVTYVQLGVGAITRPLLDKLRETVSPEDFGAVGDGVTDDSDAIQRTINALPSAGGTVLFGSKKYLMTKGVSFSKNVCFRGRGRSATTVKCVGSNGGVHFFNQTGGDELGFEFITVTGNGSTAGPIADAGSKGYQAYNNAYTVSCDFLFWETVSTWAGGYYHKHTNSKFQYNKRMFKDYDQNNIAFLGCTWRQFEDGMIVAHGDGPISFVGGSIENCAHHAFTGTSGAQIALNLFGTYIENFPAEVCPSGITSPSGKYDQGVVVYSSGSEVRCITILGCQIFTPGLFRVVYFDSTVGSHLISKGNTFTARGLGPTDSIYSMAGTSPIVEARDTIVGSLPAGATYISGLNMQLEGCSIYDPVARQMLRPTVTGYVNMALVNGFVATGGSFSTPGYVLLQDGTVRLRGVFNGGAATSSLVATLPAGYRPANIKVYSVASVNGAGANLQLQVYPTGAIIMNGAFPYANQIGMDGITFRLNE